MDDSDHLPGDLLHEVIQLYGALIVGQAGIVYAVRAHGSPALRQAVARAYCLIFWLTTGVLLKALLLGSSFNVWAYSNAALFAFLALAYTYYAFAAPQEARRSRQSHLV